MFLSPKTQKLARKLPKKRPNDDKTGCQFIIEVGRTSSAAPENFAKTERALKFWLVSCSLPTFTTVDAEILGFSAICQLGAAALL